MTDGTIRNTDVESANLDNNKKEAVSIRCYDSKVNISGGTLESMNGPALRLEGDTNGGAQDQSETIITGNAKLVSKNDTAIRIDLSSAIHEEDLAKRHVLTIDGNAALSGAGSTRISLTST